MVVFDDCGGGSWVACIRNQNIATDRLNFVTIYSKKVDWQLMVFRIQWLSKPGAPWIFLDCGLSILRRCGASHACCGGGTELVSRTPRWKQRGNLAVFLTAHIAPISQKSHRSRPNSPQCVNIEAVWVIMADLQRKPKQVNVNSVPWWRVREISASSSGLHRVTSLLRRVGNSPININTAWLRFASLQTGK